MNAPNSLSNDQRVADSKGYEPSMEEILASIRRIIADDQASMTRSKQPLTSLPEPPSETLALGVTETGWDLPAGGPAKAPDSHQETDEPTAKPDLPDSYPKTTEPAAKQERIDSHQATPVSKLAAEPQPLDLHWATAGRGSRPEPTRHPEVKPKPALSQATLVEPEDLVASIREVRPDPQPEKGPEGEDPLVSAATDAAVAASLNTLAANRYLNDNMEDIVRKMLRPMLKTWLDDNLPILVERLVRAEIERVARGGR
jgi:uncharacterized protein